LILREDRITPGAITHGGEGTPGTGRNSDASLIRPALTPPSLCV